MSPRRSAGLVARREIAEGLRSRAWRAGVAIQVLVVAGIAIASILTADDAGPADRDLAVAGAKSRAIAAKATEQGDGYGIGLRVSRERSPAAALRRVRDEDADAALVPGGIVAPTDPDPALVALLQDAGRLLAGEARLRAEGLGPRAREAVLEPPPPRTVEVSTGEEKEGEGLAFLGALLLYITILTSGYAIASSVVGEKSSRVVEVVLSAIRPVELLAGKVVGIGLLGVAQIGLVAVVGLAIAVPSGAIALPGTTVATVALVLVYYVLGYAFYGCAFAGAGSLVSRQEDTQSTSSPLLILAVGSYLAANGALGDPAGTLARVCTFLPPSAPMVVPGRAAQGVLAGWELGLSLAIMAASILLVVWLASRVYRRSVLSFGSPMKVRDLLSLLRA